MVDSATAVGVIVTIPHPFDLRVSISKNIVTWTTLSPKSCSDKMLGDLLLLDMWREVSHIQCGGHLSVC